MVSVNMKEEKQNSLSSASIKEMSRVNLRNEKALSHFFPPERILQSHFADALVENKPGKKKRAAITRVQSGKRARL